MTGVFRWIVLQTMSGSLWGSFHVVMFNIVIFMLFMAHARAVLTGWQSLVILVISPHIYLPDPGIVPLPSHRIDFSDSHSEGGSIAPKEDWTICTKCEMYRPPRAHHCRICKHCIRRMDHHCPWINNCVGEKNQKYFIQFLM